MLVQPTTIAQAQAAGSPYFWDNGKKKLAVTAEQLAAFRGGAQYDPEGGSALTQWANIQNQPQMDLQPILDIPRQQYPVDIQRQPAPPGRDLYFPESSGLRGPDRPEPTLPIHRQSPVGDDYYRWRGFNRGEAPPEPSMMDRVRGFVGGLIPRATTESGVRSENPWQLADRPSPDYGGWRDSPAPGWEQYPGERYKVEGWPGKGRGYRKSAAVDRPVREGRVAPVSYSQVALDKIADWEGFRDKPFDDVGTRRIGYGRKAKKGETTSSDKERGWLMGKVQDIGDWLDGVVTADLNANQKAALTSLVYNVGQGSFKKSKALKALNAGDMDEFKKQAFSKEQGWVKSKGKFVKGLHNRRQKEQALFFG